MTYARITGTGGYLPDKVLTNFDLEKIVDTTDDWIRERTGIEKRHIALDGQFTVDLAERASRHALEMADVKPEDLDLIVVATTTPDRIFPSTACTQSNVGSTSAVMSCSASISSPCLAAAPRNSSSGWPLLVRTPFSSLVTK